MGKVTTVEKNKIRELYESGMSLADTSDKTGRSVPTIRKYLRELGVSMRARGRPSKDGVTTPAATVEVDVLEEEVEISDEVVGPLDPSIEEQKRRVFNF